MINLGVIDKIYYIYISSNMHKIEGLEHHMDKEEIISLRKKLGLSQHALADLLGTTVTSVSRWENGHSKPMKVYVMILRKLSRANPGQVIMLHNP